MRKLYLLAAATAAVLTVALLAGCTNMAGSSSAAASSAPAASTETTTPEGATDNAGSNAATGNAPDTAGSTATAGYTAAGLNTALGNLVTYEADSAGGSLKNAIAASAIVEYATQAGSVDAATVSADALAWANTLTDDQKNALRLNWLGVSQTAKDIVADPAAQGELLQTAGVMTDFTTMDMGNVQAVLDALDSTLGTL